jgi:hypothetical protein
MTAKRVEDFFLADDLRARHCGMIADDIEACATHEEVEEVRDEWLAFFDRAGL